MKLHANTKFVDIAGFNFTISFDPNVLTLVSIDGVSTFSGSYSITQICLSVGQGQAVSGEAKEQGVLCNLCGDAGVDGEGDLATITFTARAPGTSALTITSSKVHERLCASLSLSELIHLKQNSSVAVQ